MSMSNAQKAYYERLVGCIDGIYNDEENAKRIEEAANLIAEETLKDRLIYIIGSGGHSNMVAEECMCRAGVFANINPMLDATNLFNGTVKSRMLQRNPDYAAGVLDQYYIPEGSVLIIVNAYGINALTIGLALEGKKRGLKTIAISSPDHYNNTPADQPGRHPSKKNIGDVVDILLDNHMPHGDATIDVGLDQKIAPVSTILSCFTLHMTLARAVEIVKEKGGTPDIWRSINLPGGDAYNVRLFSEYGKRIKYLL